jgi:hypothetical protein
MSGLQSAEKLAQRNEEMRQRDLIDAVARSWISTPFHNHGEVKGAGVDCATLLKRVFVEAGLVEDFDIGHYSSQWFLHHSEERYLAWVSRFAHEIAAADVKHGDVVLYHICKCYAHGAIVIKPGWPHIVHAHSAGRLVRRGDGDNPHLGTKIINKKFFSIF